MDSMMDKTRARRVRMLWAGTALALGAALAGCGGGGEDTGSGGTTPSPSPAPTPTPPVETLALGACEASGKGTDYQVGPGKTYTALDQVPWESLKAGDTVRIFYSSTPYKGKFLVAAQGTQTAPVRICGVRGPNNERPIIEGSGATTRSALLSAYGNTAETQDIHQTRSVIVVKALASGTYTDYPTWIQIDGLNIRAAHPSYTFTDAAGATKNYAQFGACVWIDRGQNILIADNEISDCQMAVFSRSTDDGDFMVTKNIRIAGNYLWGHGIAGSDREHTTYTQSVGLVIEFNRYGPLRSGALGNAVKDRSAGLVVRYNRIEGGARSVDMVEAEDFPVTATALAAYRSTFVYGNQFKKNGDDGSFFHYGGDHFGAAAGANWGETLFRRGTLYFFNNTVHGTGTNVRLFQISTTLETVEAWNNVFWFDASVTSLNLRQAENDSLSTSYTPDGILNLGVNWIRSDWTDTTAWKTLKGQVNGTANLLTGSSAPFDTSSFVPNASSAIIDAGKAGPSAASAYGVNYQLDSSYAPVARTVKGAAIDLGATER
ncbi:MAG: hypothetical protein U1F21_17160 [Sphaerotilus natans]|nr:hypothetical protein [Sphaerotilus sp.]